MTWKFETKTAEWDGGCGGVLLCRLELLELFKNLISSSKICNGTLLEEKWRAFFASFHWFGSV